MNDIKIGVVEIKDSNGTYFLDGEIFELFLDEQGNTFVKDNDPTHPAFHSITDLIEDGVVYQLKVS